MKTYAISGDEKILVTAENRHLFYGYTFIQEPETEEEKEIKQVTQEFQRSVQGMLAGYTDEEIKTFDLKLIEAKKVLDGGESEFLNGLASDGQTSEDVAKKIMEKSSQFQAGYAHFEKVMKTKINLIKSKYEDIAREKEAQEEEERKDVVKKRKKLEEGLQE